MRKLHAAHGAAVTCLLLALSHPGWSADAAQGPWQQLYTGAEATGESVIALWQFLPGQEAKDNSGRGHDLTLRGQARFSGEAPVGGALESFPADSTNDKPQGAIAKDADDLSPTGAFTLEVWFTAKPEMAQYGNVFLLDKKYYNYVKDIPEANWDYCLYLQRTAQNRRRLMASLGFGKDSDFLNGPEIEVEPGTWTHVAFTYDGAGRSRFFVNGVLAGKVFVPGRGPVAPGRYDLAIGDRFGSTHAGFPGYLAQVRISEGIVPYFTGGLLAGVGRARTVFVRMEPNATVPVIISNDSTALLTGGRAQVRFGESTKDVVLPDLPPNAEQVIPVPVGTRVRPDSYTLSVAVSASAQGKDLSVEKEIPITIVPRPLPNPMPVVMWGGGDIERLKAIGFTHQLVSLVYDGKVWEAGKPVDAMPPDQIEQQGKALDELLKAGLSGVVYVHPGTWVTSDEARKATYNRVDRAGNVRSEENVCGNFPEVREFCYNIGASVAQTFGQYPALDGALIHSEVRDGSDLCFHEHDRQAFREAAGYDIPDEVEGKNGLRYTRIKGFPTNRVVPDDDRILGFYRWFWKDGDGWNPLHSEISRGLKSTGRQDLWSFFDPAVRVPDIWGSGGDVDVISQWTYSYPDPIKMGQAADELFAMAEGKPGQQVMKMTQVIWYRSGTAPKLPEDESKRAAWEKEKPEAPFITIAPDHMREAFWSKISRPIRGIMYHGWQSLVETGSTTGYVFTNPATQGVLTELTHNVVQPLGPTLLQVPDRQADVALLESFASQMFAGRGTYGWSEAWEANMHLILQWAHLQPKILFDETVVRDGLDDYRVLVMPCCDVLTESVVRRIKDFQRRGGLVIADEFLCPAIIPDIVVPSYKRTGKAEEDKAALQAKAVALRQELDPFYTRYADSSDPDVVLRFRQSGDTDYLFALNDKRAFGDYVGHHGKVMEKGLPNSASLSIQRKAAFVYDLVQHQAVPAKTTAEGLELAVDFGPGDGRLFMLTSRQIDGVQVKAPSRARPGSVVDVTVSVVDAKGAPLAAVVPVQVEILDPQDRPAEFSGYYGAKDGKVSLRMDLAANDAPGTWTIKATELASGLTKPQRLTVAP
ncbi:MAG: LamG domain-containing protein [Armatimonadetes bacterium]|nr:LamG domain-containing protein [Armatimonadota bacterium]